MFRLISVRGVFMGFLNGFIGESQANKEKEERLLWTTLYPHVEVVVSGTYMDGFLGSLGKVC